MFVAIRGDGKQFGPDAEKAVVGGLGPAVKKGAVLLGGMFIAAKGLDQFKKGLAEIGEQQKVLAQTEAGIKSTGGAANLTAEEVSGLAEELSALSGVDDELIQQGANLLLTFTKVRSEVGEGNDVFERATAAALDLSVRGFGNVESASIALGKALQDPIKGVGLLGRSGVTFSASQKAMIASLVETGDLLGAQKIILAEVETQVGGSAKAYGETLPGQLARAQLALDDSRAALTTGFLPAIEAGAALTRTLAGALSDLPAPAQAVAGVILGTGIAIAGVARPINEVIMLYRTLRTAQLAAAGAESVANFTNSARAVDGLYASTGRATGGMGKLAGATKLLGAAGVIGGVVALGVALEDVGAKSIDLSDLLSDTGAAKAAKEYGILQDVLGDSTAGKSFQAVAEGNIVQAERLRDAIAKAGGDTELYDEILKDTATDTKQLTADQAAAGDVTDDLAGSTGELAEETEEVARTTSAADEATQRWEESLSDLLGLTLDAAGAESAYKRSINSTEDALADVEEAANAVRDGKGKDIAANEALERALLDAEDAMVDQAVAAAELAAKQAELAGGTFGAADQAAIQRQKLIELQGTLDKKNPLRQELQGYINDLQTVIDKGNIETAITMRVSGVEQVERLVAALGGLEKIAPGLVLEFGAGSFGLGGGKARGGSVWPGTVYPVGEQGVELFSPGQPGTIISNDRIRAAAGGGGFNVHGDLVLQGAGDPYQSAVEFVRQMEALEARSR